MVKHIILWQIRDGEDKDTVRKNAKTALEGLMGKIDGLISIKVNITGLESSNADMMLDTTFENESALKGYSENPLHVKAADTFVRPFTVTRLCFDYEV